MATSTLDKFKGQLECPMCLEMFKEPVTLNCGHSFCSKCLHNYVRAHATAMTKKILPCSLCRHETKVPDPDQPMAEWGKQLMPSYTIKKLVEEVNQPPETSNCDDSCFACNSLGETTPAVLWCSECEVSFCKRCSQQHTFIPSTKDHHLDKLNTKSKRMKSLKIKCPQHKKLIEFHCRDCNKSICGTCGTFQHKKCDDIVTLESMMGDMKSSISKSRQEVVATLNEKQDNLTQLKSRLEFIGSRQSVTVSTIRGMEKKTIVLVKDKFQKDVDKVNKLAEEEKLLLKAEIKTAEIDVQIFEQHSTVLREVLESEDYSEIYKTHDFCQSGSLFPQTDPDGRSEKHVVDLDYILDLESVQQMLSELGQVSVTFEDVGQMKCATGASRSLCNPILTSQMTTRTQGDKKTPLLLDITVMTVKDVDAVIVTDYYNHSVKCFYNSSHSICQLESNPFGIINLKDNRVIVVVPGVNQLVTLHVTPVLIKLKITKTQEQYRSLDMMENGQLVAGARWSGRVDVLDVSGNTATLIRTLTTPHSQITYPWYLTVSRHETHNILVSDNNTILTCMTSEGDITWTYSPPTGTSCSPRGVTTTQRGDVILVDGHSHNIIFITRSGEYKSDLLTPADSEITDPWAVHYDDRGYLYIADKDRILIYKLTEI